RRSPYLPPEDVAVLAGEGVLRLLQNANQRLLVELLERRDHRKTPDELRDQAELEQIFGLHVVQHFTRAARVARPEIGAEADLLQADAPADDVCQADERTTADEE